MSALPQHHEPLPDPEDGQHGPLHADESQDDAPHLIGAGATEYATRGARAHRSKRPHLRMVSPLRPERASRGVFALVVTGLLIVGMVVILVINTSLAQGAFTVSELQSERAALAQEEQRLVEAVTAASAPELLEQQARDLGMVPSVSPVFLKVPSGRVLGKPKAAPGGTASVPTLLTPADATMTEAVDNAAVGTDLPIAPGPDYDPAAADAAATQAAAANAAGLGITADSAAAGVNAVLAAADAINGRPSEESLWQDSTVMDVPPTGTGDAGLVAVPVG